MADKEHSEGVVPTHGFDPFEIGARVTMLSCLMEQMIAFGNAAQPNGAFMLANLRGHVLQSLAATPRAPVSDDDWQEFQLNLALVTERFFSRAEELRAHLVALQEAKAR